MDDNIIFLGLADWICDNEPNYPTFEDCKEWLNHEIKNKNLKCEITQKDEENIRMLLKYLPMSQLMNKNIT